MNVENQEQPTENKEGEAAAATQNDAEQKPAEEQQIADKTASHPRKRFKRSQSIKETKEAEEEDLSAIGYFTRPVGNQFLWNFAQEDNVEDDEQNKKVTRITAAGNYTYAIVSNKNEVYSWGMGENYVLGNRDDQNEFKPFKLDPRMFEEKKVLQIACGTQHVVALI